MTETTDIQQILEEVHEIKKAQGTMRLWDIATKAAVPVLVLVSGWMVALEVRVSVIESNRFTSGMAAQMREEIRKELPPQWLKDDLTEIKDRLKRLEQRQIERNGKDK